MTARLAVVGAAAGLLSGLLGIGGGIIIVPGLIWAAGLDRHTASGTSLVAILPIAVVAAVTYAVAPGGAFDAEASAIFVVGSVVGAVLGARLNARVSRARSAPGDGGHHGIFGLRLVIPLGFGVGKDDLPLTRSRSRCCSTSASRAASSPACWASAAARSPSPSSPSPARARCSRRASRSWRRSRR